MIIGASESNPRLWPDGIVAYAISLILPTCNPKDVLFGLFSGGDIDVKYFSL